MRGGFSAEEEQLVYGDRLLSNLQIIIIAFLTGIACLIFAAIAGTALFLVPTGPAAPPAEAAAVAPVTAAITPLPVANATPAPAFTATPLPQPTALPTKVVVTTVQPTPTPTRANCINTISGFETSGLITSVEVQDYLRTTLPAGHLENCRAIRYINKPGGVHGQGMAGNFVPGYREINIYTTGEYESATTILDTVIHELGHNVHNNIRLYNYDLDVAWATLYRDSQQDGTFVSDYAGVSKFEDFAESYMAYVRYARILQAVSPPKYEFMRQSVFDGREY